MNVANEYTELVLNDIGEEYNIDSDKLKEKYLYEESSEEEEEEEDLPVVEFETKIIDGVLYFRDKYGNIYNEKFEYIEKEENNRKRKKKKEII